MNETGGHKQTPIHPYGLGRNDPDTSDAWDDREEDGPLDLEDQLEAAIDRADLDRKREREQKP